MMSSSSKQRELEDKKREKEARARKDRLRERQQAERKYDNSMQRRTANSQPEIRYYRAGSNESQRGLRFTDAFSDRR